MSDEAVATAEATPEAAPEPRPGNEAPTGWHIYDGRDVIVQLFDRYITGIGQDGPIGTPVLQGVLKITSGSGGNGALLFILHSRQDNADAFITIQPGDVKHLTFTELRERPRVVMP